MNNNVKAKTAYFVVISLIVGVLVIAGYDIWAINKGGTEATISFLVYEWSFKYPIFTFSCGFFPGVLVGHFFWRIRDTERTKEISDDTRK